MATKFKIGQEVMVNTKEIPEKKGIIRFIGKIQGKPDEYVGIQLDEACGKNSGDVQGKPYFKIEKKTDKGQLYGVFVRPASIKLLNEPKKTTAPVVGRTSKPAPNPAPPANQGKNKLANQLLEQQNNQIQGIKEELQAAYEKIRELQELDAIKQVQSLRAKMKQLEDINRTLKREIEQVRYRSDVNQEEKLKELGEKLNFFQNQKDSAERERSELKKKIERLEAELQEGADREDMLQKLTFKVESLELKNEELKGKLEAANTQVKNTQMLGGGKGQNELEQELSTLNEMVTLLQSDLNEEKEKNAKLASQIENNSAKLNDLVKLERRLKSKDEEIQTLKSELETYADAASFVEKLTLDLIGKEQKLRDHTKKLKQYAQQVGKMEIDIVESQQMISLQTQQMESLQEEIQKHINEKGEQQKHISLLNDQINKYKQKIRELTDNNSSLLMTMEEKQDQSVIRNYFNTDIYQHKYYELSKLYQSNLQNYLDYQLQMSTIRHYAGTYLANLIDTLPETFSSKLYPHLLNLLLRITAANHKLYLLFDTTASALTHKSELYTPDQQNLASWLLMLLEQIPILYNSLLKLQFAIISADTEEDINEIISNPDLKDQITRIDVFSQELLQRVTTDTIDIEVDFDPFIEPVEVLDKVCLSVKRLPTELATRLELCSQTMRAVQQLLSSIELYRRTSEARQAAQVDTMLENFLKLLEGYLRQCCMNPHIRLKTDMKSYLSGVDLVVKILKEIELNDTLQELNSLYSETEDIKMLKETVLTTQFHLKELSNDLEQITYTTPLSRIHVKLPGKLWQDKLKEMREELGKFETTLAEKEELERVCTEQKRKILILEKEIKDRQATKQLHERRIGQLQLKVEQAGFLESDFKRQAEKLRSLEQANKLIEQELGAQSKKKKELEDDLRKTKQKFDIFQTETMMKQKKQKVSNNLSTEDISNLAIFKSVVADASALRNHQTKRKLHELSFSPILNPRQTPAREANTRREILHNLFDVKINSNFTSIQSSLSRAEFKQATPPPKDYNIGCLYLRNVQCASLTIDLNRTGLVSY